MEQKKGSKFLRSLLSDDDKRADPAELKRLNVRGLSLLEKDRLLRGEIQKEEDRQSGGSFFGRR